MSETAVLKKRKRVRILFWISFALYTISLILPYRVQRSNQVSLANGNLQSSEWEYHSGIEHLIPLLSLSVIVLLVILIYVRHTNFTRWSALLLTVLLIFPALPFYFLVASLCFYCESHPGIGLYLHVIVSVLFLITAIMKTRIPVERKKNTSTIDLLDDF